MKEPTVFKEIASGIHRPTKLCDLLPGDVISISTNPLESWIVTRGFIEVDEVWSGQGDDPGGYIQARRMEQ